jgi:hypothetical protein
MSVDTLRPQLAGLSRHGIASKIYDGDTANAHAAESLDWARQRLPFDMRVAQKSPIRILTPRVH